MIAYKVLRELSKTDKRLAEVMKTFGGVVRIYMESRNERGQHDQKDSFYNSAYSFT